MARVLVTRADSDAQSLTIALRAIGCEVVAVPLIAREVVPHSFDTPADLLLLTSAASADAAGTGLVAERRPARIAAVGPATTAAAVRAGMHVDIIGEGTGEELVKRLGELRGARVLYPRAEDASAATAEALHRAGAEVIDVICYRNVAPERSIEALTAAWPWDIATFTSPSAARRYAELCGRTALGAGSAIVAIGPSTAAEALRVGLIVDAVATRPGVEGLVAAVQHVMGVRQGSNASVP